MSCDFLTKSGFFTSGLFLSENVSEYKAIDRTEDPYLHAEGKYSVYRHLGDEAFQKLSKAPAKLHPIDDVGVLRSMSRVGTPTDNAIIEAINGWIKEELFLDFSLASVKDVPKLLDEYVNYYNNKRPSAALGYKSPVQYKTELGF